MTSFHGSMVGGALGDAMGRPTEFASVLNAGLRETALPRPALITDDTQLSIAVAQALDDAESSSEADRLTAYHDALVTRLTQWRTEADHQGRAVGGACLDATERLAHGLSWRHATSLYSKGSGTVMRAHPVAFVRDDSLRRHLAVLQSVMTHGHPTASIASAVWTQVVHGAVQGTHPLSWIDTAWDEADRSATAFEEVGALGRYERGHREMRHALTTVEIGLMHWDREIDPCTYTGPGWTAEEAVAVSLLIATRYADDPMGGIERAARTIGDSDTIASMVGALLGARHGMDAWRTADVEEIEQPYLGQIKALVPPAR